jgi:hypothetical protein
MGAPVIPTPVDDFPIKPTPSFRRTPESIPTLGKAIIQMQHGLSPVERWVRASAAYRFTLVAIAKALINLLKYKQIPVIPAKAGSHPPTRESSYNR